MRRVPLLCSVALLGALLSAGPAGAAGRAARAAAYPVTLHTSSGAVVIPSRPTRILSLSASATQMVYAIGAGRQVVGVDEYSTYPPNAPRTSFTGAETNAEDYLSKRPDLVLLAYDENHMVAQLAKLRVPAVVLPPATTVAGAEAQMNELGEITDHSSGAHRADTALNAALKSIVGGAAGKGAGQTYYIEFDPTFYSATSKSFVGSLFARLKMRNIADPAGHGSAYPQLSAEYLVKANPAYVFLADTGCCGQSASTFAKRPGFSVLRAVTHHRVVAVNDSFASEWGPHSMERFLQVIVNAINQRSANG